MNKKLIWAAWGNLNIDDKPYRNSYSKVAYRFEFPVDRFNLLNTLELDCENIVKAPIYNLSNITQDHRDRFFDAIEQTTDELFRIAEDRIIYIAYSGGVDSTLVLCAIRQHPKYKDKLEQGQIKIVLNSFSIEEYPRFFYNTILPEIPFEFIDYEKIMADENAFLVTGEMGDHITTSSDIINFINNDINLDFNSHWTNLIPYVKSIDGSDFFLEMLYGIQKKSFFEISSVNQLMWWYSQCFVYQAILVNPYIWSSLNAIDTLPTDQKVYRFFYSDIINTFSYEYISTNPSINSYEQGKKWFKEYIVNYTNDDSYYNKIKIFSQRHSLRFLNKSQIYLQDGKFSALLTNEKL
jgi:hypothetical protein